jgi:AcrR family transcriptional regulator
VPEPTSTPTKERIVDEAMRLFAEVGYRGASIAKIEQASGLSPGAGGLYRHFDSKEAVLMAGIRCHLKRLETLREVRQALGQFGNTAAEIEATARYFLDELDSQAELLRVLASEVRQHPKLLSSAVNELIESTFASFADWLYDAARGTIDRQRAQAISTVAMGSLLSTRLIRHVLGVEPAPLDDDQLVSTWVEIVSNMLKP